MPQITPRRPAAGAGSLGTQRDANIPVAQPDGDRSGPEWEAPWLATPEHPGGAADRKPPPQTATGHYGPGYLDPTLHHGDTLPGQPGDGQAPERLRGQGGAERGDAPEAGEAGSPESCPTPAAPAIERP